MMDLLIESNVLLSFFHFTKDDLAQLSKLTRLMETGQVILWLPSQEVDEVERKREDPSVVRASDRRSGKTVTRFPRNLNQVSWFTEYNSFAKTLALNFLVTYRINALTVFYAGYDDHYQQTEQIYDEFFPGTELRRTNHAIFTKLQHLFRL